jgi:DNA replication and repair protein RecF
LAHQDRARRARAAPTARGAAPGNLAGQGISGIAEIAEILPVQVIDPGVHRLIEEGSARRRRLLDWGVFHVKHEFLGVWRRYQRALQQRNAVLRGNGDEQLLAAWETELSIAGQRVDALRGEYAAQLLPYFVDIATSCSAQGWFVTDGLGKPTMTWRLNPSNPTARPAAAHEIKSAHRPAVSFFFEGAPTRDRVSRGGKSPDTAFILTAGIPGSARAPPMPMLDDPAAELMWIIWKTRGRLKIPPNSSSHRSTGGLKAQNSTKVSRKQGNSYNPHLIFQAGP